MFKFAIDRGGTFTDIYCTLPNGNIVTEKLLSDNIHYNDAPAEGIRQIMHKYGQLHDTTDFADELIDGTKIKSIRMGTTVATNALLESNGEPCCLVTTKGFKDIIKIGNQSRSDLFAMNIIKTKPIYCKVVEIDERVVIDKKECQLGLLKDNFESCMDSFGNTIIITKKICSDQVRKALSQVLKEGIYSLCVVFMHSYIYSKHETIVRDIALNMGFKQVSISSEVLPMIKLIPRGLTTCIDAYLTPCIKKYYSQFLKNFRNLDEKKVLFMMSNGGLTLVNNFTGSKSILSGPAGGVVGCVETTKFAMSQELNNIPIIGFDMGGTSTDVSRYDSKFEVVYENNINGYDIQSPQLEIKTIAAGGGSILDFKMGLMHVGPESAGSNPGSACYGKGGPLCITDANLITGHIQVDFFPQIFGSSGNEPLNYKKSFEKFEILANKINNYYKSKTFIPLTVYEVASGYIDIANEAMCRPIRSLTQSRGYDTSKHLLTCFGGAGGQHACGIARKLGISKCFIHRHAGILSAIGLQYADVIYEKQISANLMYTFDNFKSTINSELKSLHKILIQEMSYDGYVDSTNNYEISLNMKYKNTFYALLITHNVSNEFFTPNITHELIENTYNILHDLFILKYKTEFGFVLDKKKILVVDIKLKILIKENKNETTFINCLNHENYKKIEKQVFYNKKFWTTNIHFLNHLKCDEKVFGPAIIIVDTNTIFVEPNCVALVLENSNILLDIDSNVKDELIENINPIELSIFSHRFMSIAEQMGQVLQKTCVSTNIKERYDFSCAIFDLNANLVANAPHIPVHLGAMKSTLDFQIEKFKKNGKSISAILCNHPSYGGSHLPDFTVLSPVYINGNSLPSFYVANRAHHADIGGITPGSMPPNSHYLWEEGAQFESFNLVENDVFNEQDLILKLKEPAKYPKSFGSRCIDDNINDLKSQIAANNKGLHLLKKLVEEYNLNYVLRYMQYIQDNAETSVKKMFRDIIEIAPKKNVNCCAYEFTGKEYMDDGSVIELNVKMDKKNNTAIFDFSKCSDNIYGNTNTPAAVTNAAIIYCLRVLIQKDIPLNSGFLKPIEIIKRPNSILYPNKQLAVVGGNVLTSQRIVDVIFKAFQLVSPAASQGCMNNITFGDESFGYYETVGGGTGAGKHWDGADAVHSHMTNTRLTDPEILEHRYPVILKECSIRSKSGGLGKHNGGEGISRTYLFRKNLLLSVLTERRVFRPYGLYGGEDGQLGVNSLIRNGERINLTSKNTIKIQPNDIFELKTPGGGGYGRII